MFLKNSLVGILCVWSVYVIAVHAIFNCTRESFQAILPATSTALRAFHLPANSTYQDPYELAFTKPTTGLPALCLLVVNSTSSPTSSFRFGVFLPDDWNGRFATVGNGGLNGGVNWPTMGVMVKYGFAAMATDTGHNSSIIDGAWALDGNETRIDHAYRALHGSVVQAKDIVNKYYNRHISYSYFNGCSMGGRQGLMELQRYPDDFDGILVGSPGWEATKIASWYVQMGLMNLPSTAAHHIPQALFPVVRKEAMRQCDGIDGAVDGVIQDPETCRFRPEELLCSPQRPQPDCLTPAQISTLHLWYGNAFDSRFPMFFYPLTPGSEASWTALISETEPSILGINGVKYLQLQDAEWKWQDFNYDVVRRIDSRGDRSEVPEDFGAVARFAQKGGKLLHWHGLADAAVPWQTSRTFYEAVYRNLSALPEAPLIHDFYRMFFVPGMLHCHFGNGDAPWYFGAASGPENLGSSVHSVPGFGDAEHDAVLALMKWVEEDVAPSWIVGTKFVNDSVPLGVKRQRKICPYPGRAKFVGGDVDASESWEC